jgi:peroxiredoxin
MMLHVKLTALSAAVWVCAAAGPAIGQRNHTGHDEAKQIGHAPNDKKVDKKLEQLLAGMSAAEKKQIRAHVAQMPAKHRSMMLDHMSRLSLAERRKMVNQMMGGARQGRAKQTHPTTGGHRKDDKHGKSSGHGQANAHGVSGGQGTPGGHDAHEAHSKHSRSIGQSGPGTGKTTSGNRQALAVGDTVPDFEVRDLQGKTHRLSDLRKKTESGIVSLTFWCSFCHSCRDVEASMDRFARDNKGKAVVAAIDASAGETAAKVSAFAKKKGLSLPILMDAPGKAADLFGVNVTTTTIVIDGHGKLRYRGQYQDGSQALASDALAAVLAGRSVAKEETALRG